MASADNDWQTAIQAARQSYTPVTNAEVIDAIDQLRQSTDQVYRFTGGNPTVGAAWRNYLEWERLIACLKNGEDQDLAFWRKTLRRTTLLSPGLEHESFQRYRKDLRRLIHVVEALNASQPIVDFENALDQLEKSLPDSQSSPTPDAEQTISEAITLLDRQSQATSLIQRIRTTYSRPNILLSVPTDFIASQFNDPTESTSPIRMMIDGAAVRGTSRTVAHTTVSIPDNDRCVRLAISITGTSHSQSRSRKDKVTVCNTGVLQFGSTSSLTLTSNSAEISPFTSQGQLRTRITNVTSSGTNLHARFARRTAERRKSITQAEARRKGLRQLDQALYEQLSNSVASTKLRYDKEILRPLQCLDMAPGDRSVRVRNGKAEIACRLNLEEGLGATHEPNFDRIDGRPTATIHASIFNNAIAVNLAARRMSLAKVFTQLSGESSQHETSEKAKDLFVTFSSQRPLQLEFTNNQIVATFYVDKFEMDSQKYAAMDIQLAYEIDPSAPEPTFRALPPKVLMPRQPDGSRPKLAIRNYSLRRILINTLERDQPNQLLVNKIMTSIIRDSSTRIGDVQIKNGWIQLVF